MVNSVIIGILEKSQGWLMYQVLFDLLMKYRSME